MAVHWRGQHEAKDLSKTCAGLSPKEAGHSHKEDSGYEDLRPVITAILNSIKGRSKGEVKLEDLWKSSPMAKGHGLFSGPKDGEQAQAWTCPTNR